MPDLRFRSNPLVQLKPFADLAEEERAAIRDLQSDPDFYGLLVPKPPLRMNLLSVPRQTAALFQSLATPSLLGEEVLGDDESIDDVVNLVLDGILEIESGDDFLSGADALALFGAPLPAPTPGDAVARLSHEALLHAQDLETRDPEMLAGALYGYNRLPLSPFWKTRFAGPDAILAHIGTGSGSLGGLLERHWVAARTSGFLYWASKVRMRIGADDVTYKLYVSPRPERIRDAFEVAARVLSGFTGTTFKIGDSAAGLLRPDKFVAYFASREQLDAAAGELRRELAGCDAHGVPFTAPCGGDGLLSWAVDPPDEDRALQWLGRESWRFWLVKRLAAAISIAKSARGASPVEPWRFALERARRHGVNVETWTPSPRLWSAA